MTSEERLLKCYTDDVLLPRSGQCFWLVEAHFPRGSTNQHYLDLGSDTSSVWNICARFSDVISRGNQWWRREMSAVFLGYCLFRQNADLLSVLVNYEHIPPKVDLTTSTKGNWLTMGNSFRFKFESELVGSFGSLYVSGKLPTYSFPRPTLTLTSHLGQNFGLEEE